MSSTFLQHANTHNLLSTNNVINEEEEQDFYPVEDGLYDDLRNCSISSTGSIDIHGQPVTSDILVALLNRPVEMKRLSARNVQFYEALERYITETQGANAWKRFQDLVYKPREKMCDRVWMNHIQQFLAHNPVFLSKFKESVGYEEPEEQSIYSTANSNIFPPSHRPSASQSTGSNSSRRAGRRLSSKSIGDTLDYQDDTVYEDAPRVPEGMFANEDQFYHQYQQPSSNEGRRRRASYHSIQSEPHPTFVDSKIDEVDEANFEIAKGEESDHLADLIDSSDDDDDNDEDSTNDVRNRAKDIGAGYSTPTGRTRQYNDLDLVKLRDHPDVQSDLPQAHPAFFRKAKQLLSIAPSSRRFSDKIRRNSILEDAIPDSPVAELEEPRFQTCSEDEDEDKSGGPLVHIICATRNQQPDDAVWLSSILEALSGWPELIEQLHEVVQESLSK
ncbi:hypothetical protein EDC96DRAFT_508825 [Choanephora cucurbitarum]|nr:hypothetical protein EDC96DRAFT_508825 [Choanephora cucurbitarum]